MTTSYEQARAEHRWSVPARYNIAADVCDRHPIGLYSEPAGAYLPSILF
jgi:hypothetical protein